jgi:general secretion pathway protein A
VLEQIRLLTNLETAKQKLLQIILIGQPELRDVLARSDLRQLAQRITGRYHLEPLEADEVRAYVRHRLEVAGSRTEIFSAGAMKVLHQSSGGIPRLINVIADRALLGAWSQEEPAVSASMARQAAREVFGQRNKHQARRIQGMSPVVLGLAGVAIALLAGAVTHLAGERGSAPSAIVSVPPAPAVISRPVAAIPQAVAEPEPPAAPAEVPAPFGLRLARGEIPTGTDEAFAGLFGRWRASYRPDAGPACDQAQAAGLLCLLQRGTWGELATLDRPAILVLTDADGRDHQVVLSRLRDGAAELLAGETVIAVPLGELLPLWYGEYLVLWRPEAGDGRTLSRTAAGTDVLWLRRVLGELRGTPVLPADSAAYDPGLEAAVRDFQRSRRLAVDGIAGAMTLISVNNALALPGRPRLREDQ